MFAIYSKYTRVNGQMINNHDAKTNVGNLADRVHYSHEEQHFLMTRLD